MAMETIVETLSFDVMTEKTKRPFVSRNPLPLTFEEYMAALRGNETKREEQREYFKMYREMK